MCAKILGMKKITASLVLFLMIVSASFASTALSFSGNGTLVAGNGRTIRKTEVEIDEKGLVVMAGDEKITAEGDGIKVLIGKDTIATLTDDGKTFTLYVVTGEGAVCTTADRSVRIYTPTTLTEAEGSGDYYVMSTENEEYIFNHSDRDITSYDSLRNTYTTIKAGEGLNAILNKPLRAEETPVKEVTNEESAAPVTETVKVPAAPVFVNIEEEVNTPSEPVITQAERTLTAPEEPLVEVKESALTEEKTPSIKVTQTLVDIEDESGN